MAGVLARNMYCDEEGEPYEEGGESPASRWLADYCLRQLAHLRALPAEAVLKGRVDWAPIVGRSEVEAATAAQL